MIALKIQNNRNILAKLARADNFLATTELHYGEAKHKGKSVGNIAGGTQETHLLIYIYYQQIIMPIFARKICGNKAKYFVD